MAGPTPPPPGVASIGADGNRTPITRPKRRKRGEDVIDPSKGVQISNQSNTPGTLSVARNIVEVPIRGYENVGRASFKSVDGNTYSFRTKNDAGEPEPRREALAMWLSFREIGLGGNPMIVMNAFKVKIDDADGQSVFPVAVPAENNESSPSYSLGD